MTAYYNEHEPYCAAWLRNLIAAGHIAPGDVDARDIQDVTPDDLTGYTQCHFFAGVGGSPGIGSSVKQVADRGRVHHGRAWIRTHYNARSDGKWQWSMSDSWRLLTGDCLDVLATLEPESVDACVTDPPFAEAAETVR